MTGTESLILGYGFDCLLHSWIHNHFHNNCTRDKEEHKTLICEHTASENNELVISQRLIVQPAQVHLRAGVVCLCLCFVFPSNSLGKVSSSFKRRRTFFRADVTCGNGTRRCTCDVSSSGFRFGRSLTVGSSLFGGVLRVVSGKRSPTSSCRNSV